MTRSNLSKLGKNKAGFIVLDFKTYLEVMVIKTVVY